MLMRCAGTSMSSKLIANHTEFFSKMVVDAVNTLDEQLPLDMIGIKKVQGEPYQEIIQEGFIYPHCRLYSHCCPLGCCKGTGEVMDCDRNSIGFLHNVCVFCFCLLPKLISRSPSYIKRPVLPIIFGRE